MVEEKLYGQQEQEDLEESMREAFRQRDERLKKAASLKQQAASSKLDKTRGIV